MKDSIKEKRLPVGAHLKRERELREISLEEVSRVTRVRLVYLEAVEKAMWAVLPAEVYVRGYIRAYARFLGLDAEDCVARYLDAVPSARPRSAPVLEPLSGTSEPTLTLRGLTVATRPEPASTPSTRAEKGIRHPRRRSLAFALVLLVIAALTISIIYFKNQPGDASSDSRSPTTTETALFEVTG